MNIISIDLPWKSAKKGRRSLAIADLDRNIKLAPASDDNELLQLVHDFSEPGSIVLLDIPIDGFDDLDSQYFRPIDRAIAHQGLPLLPAPKVEKNRGKSLKARLEKDKNRLRVYEIYPYAIYKFLAYLKQRKLLHRLNHDKFDALLDDRFRAYWPPKYKRERQREKQLANMKYLYSLLTDADVGLRFPAPLPRPEASTNLDRLGDEYDACLGATAGLYLAGNSPYARLAGDSESGNILLLADRWLATQLSNEVKVIKLDGS